MDGCLYHANCEVWRGISIVDDDGGFYITVHILKYTVGNSLSLALNGLLVLNDAKLCLVYTYSIGIWVQ